MTDVTISTGRRLFILTNKLKMWQNTYVDESYNVKIGKSLDDEQMVKRGVANMKRTLEGIDFIKHMIEDVKSEETEG